MFEHRESGFRRVVHALLRSGLASAVKATQTLAGFFPQIRVRSIFAVFAATSLLVACHFQKAPKGSDDNPIELFFVPSVDSRVIDSNARIMKRWLEAHTPYKFKINIPQSYIAVIEAFGAKGADVAAMNTSGYIKAFEKYGVEARLIVLRHGKKTYQSQIIAKKGKFKSIEGLAGTKLAFVDAASMSGFMLPLHFLKSKGIKVHQDHVFAMKHDSVVSMIYQGQVDAGATFYSPPDPVEGIQDARRLVRAQYPDVEEKIEILSLTDEIPNDPIVFRKDLPENIKSDLVRAFLRMVETEDGKLAFKAVYGVTSIEPATDADFALVRELYRSIQNDSKESSKRKGRDSQ